MRCLTQTDFDEQWVYTRWRPGLDMNMLSGLESVMIPPDIVACRFEQIDVRSLESSLVAIGTDISVSRALYVDGSCHCRSLNVRGDVHVGGRLIVEGGIQVSGRLNATRVHAHSIEARHLIVSEIVESDGNVHVRDDLTAGGIRAGLDVVCGGTLTWSWYIHVGLSMAGARDGGAIRCLRARGGHIGRGRLYENSPDLVPTPPAQSVPEVGPRTRRVVVRRQEET